MDTLINNTHEHPYTISNSLQHFLNQIFFIFHISFFSHQPERLVLFFVLGCFLFCLIQACLCALPLANNQPHSTQHGVVRLTLPLVSPLVCAHPLHRSRVNLRTEGRGEGRRGEGREVERRAEERGEERRGEVQRKGERREAKEKHEV